MSAKQLSEAGEKLVKRCGTRDPFEIARQLGIEVIFHSNFGSMKGMYRVVRRNRFIFINRDLTPQMQRIVCAHELGHDQLHRNLAKTGALQEFMLYDMTTKPVSKKKMRNRQETPTCLPARRGVKTVLQMFLTFFIYVQT